MLSHNSPCPNEMWFLPKMTVITLQFEALTAINHKTPFFRRLKAPSCMHKPISICCFCYLFYTFCAASSWSVQHTQLSQCISILYAKPFFWMLFLLCMLIQRLLLLLVAPVIIMSTECDDAR